MDTVNRMGADRKDYGVGSGGTEKIFKQVLIDIGHGVAEGVNVHYATANVFFVKNRCGAAERLEARCRRAQLIRLDPACQMGGNGGEQIPTVKGVAH